MGQVPILTTASADSILLAGIGTTVKAARPMHRRWPADDRWADHERWMQKYTPRGPRNIWSKINRERIAALEAAGRMKPAGGAAVGVSLQGGAGTAVARVR